MLRDMGVPPVQCAPQRAIYCSRTLNLRSIQARPGCCEARACRRRAGGAHGRARRDGPGGAS